MIIGLTGRVGSGKTTAQEIIESIWHPVMIDLDIIGHQQLDSNQEKLVPIFGSQILNHKNKIDRKILGNIVFNSYNELQKLNALIHPKIRHHVLNLIQKNHDQDILIVGALIEEIGLLSQCDHIILIEADDKDILEHIGSKYTQIASFQRAQNQYRQNANTIIQNTFNTRFKDSILLHVSKLFQ